MPHPDVAVERARLEFAQSCLEAMRRRTADKVANEAVLAANQADAEAEKWLLVALTRAVQHLALTHALARPRVSRSAGSSVTTLS